MSEQMAVLELADVAINDSNENKVLMRFFIQYFDRPAFQDRICQEGRMEDFDKAIEDTLIALNTEILIFEKCRIYY